MTFFIIVNLLILLCILRFIGLYRKLKTFLPADSGKDRNGFPVIDVLFTPGLRDQPAALKIQKRAIWAFCLVFFLVYVSGQIYAMFVNV
ncbi:hypothetical protein P0Y35_08275 [Kiritimatiellaeota bacterium B1221]|nr:hypothetical protein [Kiritimatiellaeota bacterium B1221]